MLDGDSRITCPPSRRTRGEYSSSGSQMMTLGLQEDLLQILQRWVCVACPCVLSGTPRIGSRNHIPARILRLAYKKLLAVYRIGLARLRLPPHATRHHRTAPRVRGGRKLVSVDLASPILYLPSRCHRGGGMRLPLIVVLCFQPFGLLNRGFHQSGRTPLLPL